MRLCNWNVTDSKKPIVDLIIQGQVLDMTVQRNVPRFCIGSICGWNLFQPLGHVSLPLSLRDVTRWITAVWRHIHTRPPRASESITLMAVLSGFSLRGVCSCLNGKPQACSRKSLYLFISTCISTLTELNYLCINHGFVLIRNYHKCLS